MSVITTGRPLRLESLAEFMRFLTTMPDPEKVASALTRGPLAVFGARSSRIMIAPDDAKLVLVSQYGHTPLEASRYREISFDVDVPFTRACRDSRIVRVDARTMPLEVPAYSIDVELWNAMLDRLNAHVLIAVPIISDGAAIGAFSLMVSEEVAWEEVDDAFLLVLSATLGLWMSHSHSGIRESLDTPHPDLDAALNFSTRQVTILHLIDHGRSNEAIAASLGYSLSTIKAEMQAIHRTLRTHDRTSAVARAYALAILPLRPEKLPNITKGA